MNTTLPTEAPPVVGAFPPHVNGRPFEAIVEEFVRGARVPAADGSCHAAALFERIMQAAQ